MKNKKFTILTIKLVRNLWLACLLCIGSITGVNAGITASVTSPQTTYTPGINNTFTFNITTMSQGAEWVDRYQFVFPAGVTVVSGTPASAGGGCATNNGVQAICTPAISWKTNVAIPCTGAVTPTGCGVYLAPGANTFTVTVTIPAGQTGPMAVTLNTTGDGFGAPPHSDTDVITFQQFVPPVPCAIVCPADISISLDPGACNAVVNYAVLTTGDCFIDGSVTGFVGAFAPSAINYYQVGDGIFTNPPTPFTNNPPEVVFSAGNTVLTLVSADFSQPGPIYYFFYGAEWTNNTGAAQNVSFNWTYATNDGAFWDIFVLKIGNNVSNFSNSNFGNQLALWTQVSNINGANNQNGTVNIVIPAGSRLALAGYTQDAGAGPATITITNFTVGSIVPAVPVLISGIESGGTFPIGTTTNCYQITADNPQGITETSSCCFDVEVAEFATPTTTLACNDNVQVSVNEDCEAFVSTDMILEGGPYGCYDDYIVAIQGLGSGLGGVLVTSSSIGETLTVTITDPTTGNSCWGTISIEDKLPPVITCEDITLDCGTALTPVFGSESGTLNASVSPALPILDNSTATSNLDVADPAPGLISSITDVNVCINLTHTWVGDLNITLESPSGQTVTIVNFQCNVQDNYNFCIDDEAGGALTCANSNSGGTFTPGLGGTALSAFDGGVPNGTWLLHVTDNVGADQGVLNFWSLSISYDAVAAVQASDNCEDPELTYTDIPFGDPCEGSTIIRIWTATDGSGNTATCEQEITILPLEIETVLCPVAYVGSCSQGDEDISPDVTGWPTVNGVEITDENNLCNLFVGYWDKELNDCGEGVKIIRTWTILDWCTQETVECVQVIKVSDDEAPILTCPSNITVGTDFWYCYANVSVPKPTVFDECGSSWTLSMASSAGIIVNFGNNFVINQLGLGVHTVTWTATDECGNISTCTFTVTVVDDVAPIAICDEHTIVALTNDGPFGVTLVPAEVFDDGSYDACGPVTFTAFRMPEDNCPDFDYFDWTTNGACIDHIPGGVPPINSRDRGNVARPCVPFFCCDVGRGPIMVQLIVEDAAGNQNFCMVEIEVQDKISPFIECPPDITVSCDFWFAVEEGTFVDADGNNNGNLDEDPLSHVFGNMFDAFRYNDDESFREDIIINDPGALPFISPQPHFWGIDGWADDNCEVNLSVRVRVFDDCSGEDFPVTPPAGAVRLIERRFSASDGGVGIAPGTCTQRIWVIDYEPFFITDITCFNSNPNDGVIWPCDVILTTCPDNIGDLEGPIVFDDACSLIGVAFEDTRFNFVDGACFKILRKWSVIDWCQYNPLTGEGIWMYVQVIKVHDHDGPEFLDCPVGPVVLCVADTGVSLPANNQVFLGEGNPLASRCSAHLNLCKTVHETCSDFVDFDVKIWLHNGPSFIQVKPLTTVAVDTGTNNALLCFDTRESTIQAIRLNGIPYNSMWCGDYHRILWSVEDDCGNFSFCEYLFRLEDCKQPSPVCINGLSTVVMPVGGLVTIWAKDFDASSFDDCTSSDSLLFSFSGDSYQPSFTYNCDNVPAFGVELSVNIWVADNGTDDNCNGQISWNERNKDFCTTTIVITDNVGVCDTIGSGSILGEIYTEDVESVEKVAVSLTSPGHVFPTYVTVEDGKYNFNNIILPADYEITSDRNDDHVNGVSTLDLVKIQKHLLGIEAMNSPYDLIAADANSSQNVSAIDLVELRKLILGVYTVLPNNESWRFVTKDFVFADPTHPWPFDEVIDITNMTSGVGSQDFIAVKIGDVNNTVQANALQILPRNGHGVVNFVADERTVNAGEIVDVTITSADFAGIEGYQFTMQTTGLEFRGIEGGAVSMNEENMGVFGSTLTASWHKIGGVSAGTSDVLFTLQFQATAAGKLSQMIALNSRETKAEAYNTTSDIKDLKLTFRGAENGAEFALYQNEPNPFKGNTVIGYDLPEAGNVTLTIFDVTGKAVYVKEQNSVKGYNTIAISSKEMPSIGVLYYRLDANEYTATKKMIIIE